MVKWALTLSKADWPYLLLGGLSSMVQGACFPAMAISMAEVIAHILNNAVRPYQWLFDELIPLIPSIRSRMNQWQ